MFDLPVSISVEYSLDTPIGIAYVLCHGDEENKSKILMLKNRYLGQVENEEEAKQKVFQYLNKVLLELRELLKIG